MKISFKEINTLANYISLLRVLIAIPIFVLLDYINISYNYRLILAFLFIFAAFTDFLDGYVARKKNQITEVGKIIDPFADKLCIAIIVIKLYLISEIPGYFFWIIILRDVLIFISGIFVSRKVGKVLPSNMMGKITAFSIGFFLVLVVLGLKEYGTLFYMCIWLCITLSVASLAAYAIRGYETIKYYRNGTI